MASKILNGCEVNCAWNAILHCQAHTKRQSFPWELPHENQGSSGSEDKGENAGIFHKSSGAH